MQLTTKDHQQGYAQNKSWDGIAHQHQQTGERVEARTRPHRLGDAQRHRHQIAQKKRPQAQADGHGQLFLDQAPDVFGVEKAFAQIELRKLLEHHPETLSGWLVKTVECFDFGNAGRIHALPATVTAACSCRALPACVPTLQLGHHLLNGPTRHKLDHRKRQQQHPEQSRDHQQQAFENVGQHGSGGLGGRLCNLGRRCGRSMG